MNSLMIRRAALTLSAALALSVGLGCAGSQEINHRNGRVAAAGTGAAPAAVPAAQAGWPAVFLREYAAGLDFPTAITHAGDGSGRLFVTERAGRVRIVRDGAVEAQPFLDISDRVRSGGEQGLLWTEFPPGHAQSRRFYVNYTRRPDGATVVARFGLTADPDDADEASEEVLLVVAQPFANHNGGQMAFGPEDGYLYIALGDGGSGGDPMNNAQNHGTLLGKILRIDVESAQTPYAVPPDNPFVGQAGRRPEIWALGLRNPWRFSFDRETNDLYIADVGQNAREEVDFQPAASGGGENYGWRYYEGTMIFSPNDPPPQSYVPPVAEYDHSLGCSITGGYVYRGEAYPQLQGIYFYGDYCSGSVWGLRRSGGAWEDRVLVESGMSITTFGEDESGNIYAADGDAGTIHLLFSERAKRGVVRK